MPEYDNPQKTLPGPRATRVVLDNLDYSERELVQPMRAKWEIYEKAYRCYSQIDDDSVASNFFIPLIFSHVESYLPRLVANRPRVEVWGREEADLSRAAMHRGLIFYDWDILNMPWELVNYAKCAEVLGTAWFKVTHKKDIRKRPIRNTGPLVDFRRRLGLPVEEYKVGDTTVWDDAHIELMETDQVYPHPAAKNENDAPWICDVTKVTLAQLEGAKRNGQSLYNKEVLGKLREKMKDTNPLAKLRKGQTLREIRQQTFGAERTPEVDPLQREVHLVSQYTDDKVVVVVNEFPDLEPLLNEANIEGVKPYVRYTPIPVWNEMYGIAIPELLYSLNLEANQLHNSRMDHLLSSVHRMFSIIRGRNVNPRQLRHRPNGWFWVDEHTDVQERDLAPLEFSLYRESEEIRRWAQQASGATDPFMGLESRGGTSTATEAQLLASASGTRAGLMFSILSHQALGPLGEKLIRINENHKDQRDRIRILGDDFADPEFVDIDPNVLASRAGIRLDVLIDVAATEPETRQFRLQRALNALQVVGQIPPEALANPVVKRLFVEMLQGFGIERPDQLVEQSAQQGQLLAAQAQQSGSPEGQSQAVSPGEQLAALGGGSAPNTGAG